MLSLYRIHFPLALLAKPLLVLQGSTEVSFPPIKSSPILVSDENVFILCTYRRLSLKVYFDISVALPGLTLI